LIAAVALAGDVLSIVADKRKIVSQGRADQRSRDRNADGPDDQTSRQTNRISHALTSAISPTIDMAGAGVARRKVLAKPEGSANPITAHVGLAEGLANEKAAPKRRRLDSDAIVSVR
jgi:hypothetical protein